MNLKTLTGQVEYILSSNAESRNSDITLTIALWRRFFPNKIQQNIGSKGGELADAVLLKDLFDLPREDNIKRIRAKFQNDQHLYLPTEQKIAEGRGILAEIWREAMGHTPTTFHRI